jgi:2-C-methyl-D-erythritol 2,4-cyclodiphosphate synthase
MPIDQPMNRTGFGFDSHAFDAKGSLVLGGVRFPGTPALKGHSDGDALLHAVIDALLGAACLGDIGEFFPDTSPTFKGASSVRFVKATLVALREKKWTPVHVDVTVVANKPRLTPNKSKIKIKLARLLKLPTSSVNIKAKTQEGLTWFVESGGIAVWAVATVERRS